MILLDELKAVNGFGVWAAHQYGHILKEWESKNLCVYLVNRNETSYTWCAYNLKFLNAGSIEYLEQCLGPAPMKKELQIGIGATIGIGANYSVGKISKFLKKDMNRRQASQYIVSLCMIAGLGVTGLLNHDSQLLNYIKRAELMDSITQYAQKVETRNYFI